jgi:Ni2+-binding GTPase involved in maturation of urease and hydrogenase
MKFITVAGPPSSGKTAVIINVLNHLMRDGIKVAVGKIDSIETSDGTRYRELGIPAAVGLSEDLCPDHYYVSNLEEILKWAKSEQAEIAIVETAGLCHRCAPAIVGCLSIAIIDNLSGIDTPGKIGPVLSTADIVAVTKGDIVSQAEREVFRYKIGLVNPGAEIMEINGLTGTGSVRLKQRIINAPEVDTLCDKDLRTAMPACICSYCTGETRIGNAYQFGHVIKIESPEKEVIKNVSDK